MTPSVTTTILNTTTCGITHKTWAIIISFASALWFLWDWGYIPYTDNYYHRKFEYYYFGIINARNCHDITTLTDMMSDSGLADWTMSRGDDWAAAYPIEPLAATVNSMECHDKDGELIVM